jgi:hypothetical protein
MGRTIMFILLKNPQKLLFFKFISLIFRIFKISGALIVNKGCVIAKWLVRLTTAWQVPGSILAAGPLRLWVRFFKP